MAKKQFKTESKRVLELMINSIYTNREIFLRELISNASDAIDKLYFHTLEGGSGLARNDFEILLAADKENRTLTVSDNGCGMTRDDLEKNLGTIAKSGTLDFKSENADKLDELEVIGQFGVGFYAGFMVANKLSVLSRAYGSDEAYLWESDGVDGYTVSPAVRDSYGTDVTLTLKADAEDENYSELLDQYKLASLVKKYSDYIRYPIKTMREKRRPKEDAENEYESYFELDTLNSMTPIWKKGKNEITEEEYKGFYQDKFYDYAEPLRTVHYNTEGLVSYTALLFIPAKAPYNFYTKEFSRGLQLYSNGVLIMESCSDLLPDYFGFVRGLIDSPDVSLNISREVLQQDRQLKTIAKSVEKKIKSELLKLLSEDREKYKEFYKEFGLPLKYGVYQDFGANKDNLKDIIMFDSLNTGSLVTLSDYAASMPEAQTHIYYASGETAAKIAQLPQTEILREKGYDILCLTADVDEFVIKILDEFEGKKFMSASSDDLGLVSDEEKQETEKQSDEHKDMLELMRDSLGISAVKISSRLKSSPVCLTAEGDLSLEMEKVLSAMPGSGGVTAKRVLELNAAHPLFATLCALYENDRDKLKKYASLLYTQAALIEGLDAGDLVRFSNDVCELMV
ncbi:MAG: molecular chaperone HtpG [Oscillospiraceae bacterium]|jgi:molecular chaperone HtpG|nr:molecular chaperone HtpG [Oscillospiraceae bacterium]